MTKKNISLSWKIASLLSLLALIIYINLKNENLEKKGPTLNTETIVSLSKEPKNEKGNKDTKKQEQYEKVVQEVRKNSNFYETLQKNNIPAQEILTLIKATKPYYDLSLLPEKSVLTLLKNKLNNTLIQLQYHLTPSKLLILKKNNKSWTASIEKLALSKVETFFYGRIQDSLWQALINKGIPASLANEFITILSWQIDFAREARKDDSWQILVEKIYIEGKHSGWGEILIAEYQLKNRKISAILFKNTPNKGDYYDLQGQSIRGLFLKSPLRYSRISSRFTMNRFHPVLKRSRPHLGVDYAAPRGTPVYSVGEGKVSLVTRTKAGGKTIKIKHTATYQTAYKHLSKFAKGIRKGKKVSQGQIIAYVGSTGLATGAHLHFEFFEKGHYVDPLGRKFPRMGSILQKKKPEFNDLARQYQKKLRRYAMKQEEFR